MHTTHIHHTQCRMCYLCACVCACRVRVRLCRGEAPEESQHYTTSHKRVIQRWDLEGRGTRTSVSLLQSTQLPEQRLSMAQHGSAVDCLAVKRSLCGSVASHGFLQGVKLRFLDWTNLQIMKGKARTPPHEAISSPT